MNASDIITGIHVDIETAQSGTLFKFDVTFDGKNVLDAVERSMLEWAINRAGGNQSQASRLLGISRYALRYRMARYGLSAAGPASVNVRESAQGQ